MENFAIINDQSYSSAREDHAGNKTAWLNYSRRMIKHPFIKDILFNKYQGKCQYCGKDLTAGWVIHHAKYNKECLYPENTIRIPHPTEKRPDRTSLVPNCEHCNNLDECLRDLYPVCQGCNLKIAGELSKQKQKKIKDQEAKSQLLTNQELSFVRTSISNGLDIAITGLSGVGKTTLFNEIVKLIVTEFPNEGYFFIDECFTEQCQNINALLDWNKRKVVVVLPQGTNVPIKDKISNFNGIRITLRENYEKEIGFVKR